jgi:hypothetical protein
VRDSRRLWLNPQPAPGILTDASSTLDFSLESCTPDAQVSAVHCQQVAMPIKGVGGTSLTTAGFRAALQQRSFASNITGGYCMDAAPRHIQVTRAILCPGDQLRVAA